MVNYCRVTDKSYAQVDELKIVESEISNLLNNTDLRDEILFGTDYAMNSLYDTFKCESDLDVLGIDICSSSEDAPYYFDGTKCSKQILSLSIHFETLDPAESLVGP